VSVLGAIMLREIELSSRAPFQSTQPEARVDFGVEGPAPGTKGRELGKFVAA